MEMYPSAYMMLPGISPEEIGFLQQATTGLDDNQKKYFFNVYAGKRKNPQDILLLALLGFIIVAGVHRFVMGQIGMGLLYFFTGGFCLIGTLVDLINYQTLALEYNKKMAFESFQLIQMNGGKF